MPEHRSMKEVYRLLFAGRQCTLIRFGQAEDDPDLGAEIKAMATDDLQGVDLEVQVQASRGLFPVLVLSWEAVFPRDMAASGVEDHLSQRRSRGVQAEFTYSVAFGSREMCAHLYRELIRRLQSRTHAGLPPQMQRVAVGRDLVITEQLWPVRRGDRIVQAYFAKAPIPGRNPQG